jgi:hypothetical protein
MSHLKHSPLKEKYFVLNEDQKFAKILVLIAILNKS